MTNVKETLTDKHLLILGLARQGQALARFACGVGAQVTVSDLRTAEQLTDELAALAELPITYALGGHPATLLDTADLVALSGSVPIDAPFVQRARAQGVPLTNDSQEFVRRCPAPAIGITGSAGKTTTTALLGAMGECAQRPTWVGGNIGRPLLTDLAHIQSDHVVVQELSSFQLDLWRQSPHIAVVLNITPNHLDRHHTMAQYTAAKANIVRHQTAADTAILCADDAGAMALAPFVGGRLRTFGLTQPVSDGAFVRDEQIWLTDGQIETAVCPLGDIHLRGRHNRYNVLAACIAADSAGLPATAMRAAITQFMGVAHRLEWVATIDGVQYINDSIATTPERVLAALQAFDEPLVLLAGGRDKDMVWDAWARCVSQRAKAIVLFGDLAPQLVAQLQTADQSSAATIAQTHTLADAVATAHQLAAAGDVVLLSPGGTSFDAFQDFAARGQQFKQLVRTLLAHTTPLQESYAIT